MSDHSDPGPQRKGPSTRLIHSGRPDIGTGTPVNPRIERASTLLFDDANDLYRGDVRGYGRHGSSVEDHLKTLFNQLEGGAGTSLLPSGLAACSLAILSSVSAGDHILVTDSVYGPTRAFCQTTLKQFGVEAEFYPPHIGAGVAELVRDTTTAVVMEAPGSLTFEVQDIPAIVAASGRATTIIDNTWSGGISLKPLALGVDLSVQAATKYIGGHSDTMFGAVIARTSEQAARVARTRKLLGHAVSPDDAFQILKGFRTLVRRFRISEATAHALATRIQDHDKVVEVLHPALRAHPDYDIWARDFSGGAGLFGVVIATEDAPAFINSLQLFGIGYSYGGYESLAIHCDPQLRRKYPPDFNGKLVRFACGLEDAEDLVADVLQALDQL